MLPLLELSLLEFNEVGKDIESKHFNLGLNNNKNKNKNLIKNKIKKQKN